MNPDEYELLIFDRWGELIFTSNDMNIGWDGTYMGRPAQIDVYVWKLETSELESKKEVKKMGRVSLVR
jgi:gliding motility-associated-like protein